LKTGGDYGIEHVEILHRMAKNSLPRMDEFICYTDAGELPIEGVTSKPLRYNLPGRYSMLEAFWETGKVIVTGLDTIFIGTGLDKVWDVLDDTGSNEFYMIKPFRPRAKREFINGVMAWNGDWTKLITDYKPEFCLPFRMEMSCTVFKLKQFGAKIRPLDDFIRIGSYKYGHRNDQRSPNLDVLCFHGTPRPHEVKNRWIVKLYAWQGKEYESTETSRLAM